jgi:hypothetical protein
MPQDGEPEHLKLAAGTNQSSAEELQIAKRRRQTAGAKFRSAAGHLQDIAALHGASIQVETAHEIHELLLDKEEFDEGSERRTTLFSVKFGHTGGRETKVMTSG